MSQESTSVLAILDLRQQRRTLIVGVAVAAPIMLLLGWSVYLGTATINGVMPPLERLSFALRCIAVAVLLGLLPAIEAVSHERLSSQAIDPLEGTETRRLRVNLRYLQNTLEQTVLFASGLLGLAGYSTSPGAMRVVVATTVTWIVARWAFWIGYHVGPRFRGVGLTGMAQSLLVLLYVCGRFGWEWGGPVGLGVTIGPFLAIELYLVAVTRRPPRPMG